MQPFSNRVNKLLSLMTKKNLDVVFTSSLNNVFYYTGFEMSRDDSALLSVSKKGEVDLFVSPLTNSAETLKTAKVHFMSDLKDMQKVLEKNLKIGYDEYDLKVVAFDKLKALCSKSKFYPCGEMLRKPREIKEAGEIENIKKALTITESVLKKLETHGSTEYQIAADVDYGFRKNNAGNAFETIVSAGKRTFFIHYVPQNLKINSNDAVLVDCGARFKGYCADITRMFYKKTTEKEKMIFEEVKNMQKMLIDKIRDGVKFDDVDNLYKKLLDKKKYAMLHSFGHNVGLDVHDLTSRGELKAGMVITVEPGIYVKGFGGCRLEDVVLVKKDKAQLLSGFVFRH